jgi:hypothetical protein
VAAETILRAIMSRNTRIGSAFRLIGFGFLVVAIVPAFRGEGVNVGLLAPGLAFWVIGLVLGLRARRETPLD